MTKALTNYYIFALACMVVLLVFVTSKTFTQLIIAILLYPLLILFAYKVLPLRKQVKIKSDENKLSEEIVENINPSAALETEKATKRDSITISDIDKRAFLKLIGGTGIFLFVMSLFNKRAENLFFKGVPGSTSSGNVILEDMAGKRVDPAQNQPTDGYKVSEIEDNTISFYGYTNKDGGWFVMRVDTENGSFRYARGDDNFPAYWKNRENLEYDYYNNVF